MALHVPLAGSYSSALQERRRRYSSPCHQHLAVGQQRRRVTMRAVVRLPVLPNVNGASAGERLWDDAGPAITRSLSPAATGLMGALNPLVAGAALKLEASKTAEIDNRAIERATWSAQARIELFCCFFMELFRLNQFSCRFFLSSAQHCRVRLGKAAGVPKAAAFTPAELDGRGRGGAFQAGSGGTADHQVRGGRRLFYCQRVLTLSSMESSENTACAGSAYRGKAAIFRYRSTMAYRGSLRQAFCIGKKRVCHGGRSRRGFAMMVIRICG